MDPRVTLVAVDDTVCALCWTDDAFAWVGIVDAIANILGPLENIRECFSLQVSAGSESLTEDGTETHEFCRSVLLLLRRHGEVELKASADPWAMRLRGESCVELISPKPDDRLPPTARRFFSGMQKLSREMRVAEFQDLSRPS